MKRLMLGVALSLIVCLGFSTPVFAGDPMDVDIVVVGDDADLEVDMIGDNTKATVNCDEATVNANEAVVNAAGGDDSVTVNGQNLSNFMVHDPSCVPWDYQNRQMIYQLQDHLGITANRLNMTMEGLAKIIVATEGQDATLSDLSEFVTSNGQDINEVLDQLNSQLDQLENLEDWDATQGNSMVMMQEQINGLRASLQEENDYFVDAMNFDRTNQAQFMQSVQDSHELEQAQLRYMQTRLSQETLKVKYLICGSSIGFAFLLALLALLISTVLKKRRV